MGSGVKEAHAPPHLSLHLLRCLGVQQPRSVQECQISPTEFSGGPATTLGDGGSTNFCVEGLTAQDGVGSGGFSTTSLSQKYKPDLSEG